MARVADHYEGDRYGGVVDPAIVLSPTPGPREWLGKVAAALALIVAVTLLLMGMSSVVDRAAPGDLVWPVGPDVWAGVVFLSAFLLILAGARIASRAAQAPPFGADGGGWARRADALVGGPILLVVLVSGSARVAVQVAGFAGLHPLAVPAPFGVVAVAAERGRHETRTHYLLRLRYGEGGRVFSREVAEPVHDAARVGDTVTLPVETGRFGLQRAMAPAPITIGDLHHATPAG